MELHFILALGLWPSMSYVVPRSVLDVLQRPGVPVLYFAGSFNPPHAGHLEAMSTAAQQVTEKPIFIVAPKSDERLREKMDLCKSFMFPWSERVQLFQKLLELQGHHWEVHFDSYWRHFTGTASQIRRETDAAFGALNCQVFRVLGEDRVEAHGLEDDPMVLATPRKFHLSSTQIRRLLVEEPHALDALVGTKLARAYMQSFAKL